MADKRYIGPCGWFAINYPRDWSEDADEEGTFLFYNPNRWNGNFRISVYSDKAPNFACTLCADELKRDAHAKLEKVGKWSCVYTRQFFIEEGQKYVTHSWLTGKDNCVARCSFTTFQDSPIDEALTVLSSLELRTDQQHYPREIIAVRLLEIYIINESYARGSANLKRILKRDFTASYDDIARLQQLIDGNYLLANDHKSWLDIGFLFCAILVNEMDGMQWVTVVDDKNEYVALRFRKTDVVICPTFIDEQHRKGVAIRLEKEFERIKQTIEATL